MTSRYLPVDADDLPILLTRNKERNRTSEDGVMLLVSYRVDASGQRYLEPIARAIAHQ
ncbi:MAG: hypothetical protein AAF327_11225 [Cyanobacteria bacterium P01_A01_bin.37]